MPDEIIRDEWKICQDGISRYDNLLFQIRSWAVTAASGIITLSFTVGERTLALIAIPVVLSFWLAEGSSKVYQNVFIHRGREIERCMKYRDGPYRYEIESPILADLFAEKAFKNNHNRILAVNYLNHVIRHTYWAIRETITGHSFPVYALLITLSALAGNGLIPGDTGARKMTEKSSIKIVVQRPNQDVGKPCPPAASDATPMQHEAQKRLISKP